MARKAEPGVQIPAWCPGCGNFGILKAVDQALDELRIERHKVLMVSGIGQAGKLPHYTKCNSLNALHGRTLPSASAAKLANRDLTVIAIGGDGDGYAEGGNHFLNAARRNHDITYLIHDNQIYGLTKGQASPTSDEGFVTGTSPHGAGRPINSIPMAIVAGATFVARGFAGDAEQLSSIIKAGIEHRGFAIIDILQPCVSFNHVNTFKWYRERVYKLEGHGYDNTDRMAAIRKGYEWGERIPTGIIYQEERQTYEDGWPALKSAPLIERKTEPEELEKLFGEFL
ncbi:MAG: 2-oxoacid:ferredoxin oxidoreductase subunit beta [Dehalococcoidia bacterium]